jgi:hypothetical protein
VWEAGQVPRGREAFPQDAAVSPHTHLSLFSTSLPDRWSMQPPTRCLEHLDIVNEVSDPRFGFIYALWKKWDPCEH